jgi:hypothetical protein
MVFRISLLLAVFLAVFLQSLQPKKLRDAILRQKQESGFCKSKKRLTCLPNE